MYVFQATHPTSGLEIRFSFTGNDLAHSPASIYQLSAI